MPSMLNVISIISTAVTITLLIFDRPGAIHLALSLLLVYNLINSWKDD